MPNADKPFPLEDKDNNNPFLGDTYISPQVHSFGKELAYIIGKVGNNGMSEN